jgi:hypothetical protein
MSRNLFWTGLLAACGLMLAPMEGRAGLFDFLRPKPKQDSSAVARGQTPDPRYAQYPTPNGWQPPGGNYPAGDPAGSFPQDDPNAGNGWGSESSPCYNCGEMDRHQTLIQHWRKKCHQTYYPRSAPYCRPDWGWYQSCWRRMPDNYTCQRPDYHGSTPQPQVPLPPATPVVPPLGVPAGAPLGPQSRAYPPSRPDGYGRNEYSTSRRTTGPGNPRYAGYSNAGASAYGDQQAGEWIEIEEPADDARYDAGAQQPERSAYYAAPASRR